MVPGERGEGNDESEVEVCEEGEYRLSTGECVTDSHPECGDGEFYNKWISSSCIACPTEGNLVEISVSDVEDSCEKCAGAQYGGYYPNYCVYCPSGVVCGDQCCGEGQMCQYSSGTYTCVSELGDGECWTNDDCAGANQYCQNGGSCEVTIGTCETISSTAVIINGKEYTASTDFVSYQAAEVAVGKRMLELEWSKMVMRPPIKSGVTDYLWGRG